MAKRKETPLPFRGWGKGSVPVLHALEGQSTIAEARLPLLGTAYVYGLVDTPERLERGHILGTGLLWNRFRFLVPKEYTHLRMEADIRWKVGFPTSDDCRVPVGTVTGRHPDVLLHRGPAVTALLEVGSGYAKVHHTRPDAPEDQHREIAHVSRGPFRGRVEIPGPGLILVDTLVRWKLTVNPPPPA